MTPPEVQAYLARIGWTGAVEPTLATLRGLQLAHLTTVAFENLDVFRRVPVSTERAWSVPKIVEHHRGGWCFELNGAFSGLLRALGYDVTLVSSQVFDAAAGSLGPELDHLCLVVVVDGERWLVDVGFGDSPLEPVRLDASGEQHVAPRPVRIEPAGDRLDLVERVHGVWTLQYRIDPTPRELHEFAGRSEALWTTGYFTEKPFATRALDGHGGRVWLLRDRLKTVTGPDADPVEVPVPPEQWEATLAEWFAMTPPPSPSP